MTTGSFRMRRRWLLYGSLAAGAGKRSAQSSLPFASNTRRVSTSMTYSEGSPEGALQGRHNPMATTARAAAASTKAASGRRKSVLEGLSPSAGGSAWAGWASASEAIAAPSIWSAVVSGAAVSSESRSPGRSLKSRVRSTASRQASSSSVSA